MQTLHSIIGDGQRTSSSDVYTVTSSRQMVLISEQWRLIWQRVTQRLEAVDRSLLQWHSFRSNIDNLRRRLSQIEDVVARSIPDDVASVQEKRGLISRLKVRQFLRTVYQDNHKVVILGYIVA